MENLSTPLFVKPNDTRLTDECETLYYELLRDRTGSPLMSWNGESLAHYSMFKESNFGNTKIAYAEFLRRLSGRTSAPVNLFYPSEINAVTFDNVSVARRLRDGERRIVLDVTTSSIDGSRSATG